MGRTHLDNGIFNLMQSMVAHQVSMASLGWEFSATTTMVAIHGTTAGISRFSRHGKGIIGFYQRSTGLERCSTRISLWTIFSSTQTLSMHRIQVIKIITSVKEIRTA